MPCYQQKVCVTPSIFKYFDNGTLDYAMIFNSLNYDLDVELDDEFADYLDTYLDLDDLAKLIILRNRYKQGSCMKKKIYEQLISIAWYPKRLRDWGMPIDKTV